MDNSTSGPTSVRVRPARRDESLDVRRILDAAMLEPGDVEARVNAGDVLVAAEPADRVGGDAARANGGVDGSEPADERILGAVVLEPLEAEEGAHVAAVAVRRRRRDRGVGTALVESALERAGRLTARFDGDLAPFYESLGFSIDPIDERRCRGTLERPR